MLRVAKAMTAKLTVHVATKVYKLFIQTFVLQAAPFLTQDSWCDCMIP